jgi:hypothetical protein
MGFTDAALGDMTGPRVFKTHLPIKYLPDNVQNNAKVILN